MQGATASMGVHEGARVNQSKWGLRGEGVVVCRMCVEDGALSREAEQRRRHGGGRVWAADCQGRGAETNGTSETVGSLSDLPEHSCSAAASTRGGTCLGPGDTSPYSPVSGAAEGSTTFHLDLTQHPWSPANCGIPSHYGKQGRDDLVWACGCGTPVCTGGLDVCFPACLLVLPATLCRWHLYPCDCLIFAVWHILDLLAWHKCHLFTILLLLKKNTLDWSCESPQQCLIIVPLILHTAVVVGVVLRVTVRKLNSLNHWLSQIFAKHLNVPAAFILYICGRSLIGLIAFYKCLFPCFRFLIFPWVKRVINSSDSDMLPLRLVVLTYSDQG